MSDNKKCWTTEEIASLIDTFRGHRNLWDPKNADYKNRIKKMNSFKEIAIIFDTTCTEVDRKWKNLLSQYQRERRNYQKMKKCGAGHCFKPKWFGYNAMTFLQNKDNPSKGVQVRVESESSDEEKQTEPHENCEPSEDASCAPRKNTPTVPVEKVSNTSTNLNLQKQPDLLTPKKKSKKRNDNNLDEASESIQVFQLMKSIYQRRALRDEYDVFGELVAHNIRSLQSEYTKINIQQQITNLLYDSRIFEFPQHVAPSSPTPSPSRNIRTRHQFH